MLIRRLYTICLLALLWCVNIAMAQPIESFNDPILSPEVTTELSSHLLGAERKWPVQTTDLATITQDDDRSVFDEGHEAYIFNALRRIKSVDQYAGMGIKPVFSQVFEFHPPSYLHRALTPTALPTLQSHWVGHIPHNHNRLSGWKEGNLLYSHRFG
ncbi:hypothetical protein H744_2c1874 [Photobacterium gaetbulicola Gung47]|uniref:Uncharacterized protein n=1 Tax=Photobacterium gaetbulicola Gung47 TaxID=658445 RepID=A0A0C5WZQ1_9GAMM|nr:hypothetical protein [Photobacterium gaetbulicola]AJR08540.1 hypothetical protein H744_2c1874 [Photobacterium gaetbulicola Gung47]